MQGRNHPVTPVRHREQVSVAHIVSEKRLTSHRVLKTIEYTGAPFALTVTVERKVASVTVPAVDAHALGAIGLLCT